MISSLLRYFIGRRLLRVLPGGGLLMLLFSAPSRAAGRWAWQRFRGGRRPGYGSSPPRGALPPSAPPR